jgi:hypothetical protein
MGWAMEQDEEDDDLPDPLIIHPQTIRRSLGK